MSPACLAAGASQTQTIFLILSVAFFVSSLAVLGAALGVALTASTSTSTTASACASNSPASNSGNTAATSAANTTSAGTASSIVTTTASTISANGTTTGALTTISLPAMTATITATSTYCVTTSITSAVTASPTPAQCTNATLISDVTRSAGFQGAYSCDAFGALANPGWYNFTGPGGMILANCVVASNLCGAQATGWYSGVYPSTPGQTLNSNACFNFNGNSCNWLTSIKITNCNGYYVFYLTPPPVCNLRYCTV